MARHKEAPVAAEASPRPRRRLPGVNLRPGAVKQARQEAQLSLAQVGKGYVTAPAIYLIETGRTRPSLPTLEHIATRTGKPVEFFLADRGAIVDDGQAGVAELEAKIADGRFEEAIALGSSLLSLGTSVHRLGRIRYFLAMAHLQLGEPDRAAVLLAEARAHFEAVNDGPMLVECLGAEASLAVLTQQPDSLARAAKALAAVRALDPVPQVTESRMLTIVASAHAVNQDWDQAIKLYEEAIASAGSLFDLRRLSKMYAGLSSAYQSSGQMDAAARYGTRSVALNEVLHDRVSLARAESSLGLLLLARGDEKAARQHIERSVQLADETELQVGRSKMLLSACELCLQEGNIAQAGKFAEEALGLAESLREDSNVAEAHMWIGLVADTLGDHQKADREFAVSIQGLERLGAPERLLRAHGMYAEALEKRGDVARAYAHMKEALHASRPGMLAKRPDEEHARSV
jgi:tetratricopeptide (TPR) repeat protein